MLNLSVTIDNISYESVIDQFFPLLIKNKLMLKSAQIAAKSIMKNKTQAEQDEFVANFITSHKEKILAYLSDALPEHKLFLKIKDINAEKQ